MVVRGDRAMFMILHIDGDHPACAGTSVIYTSTVLAMQRGSSIGIRRMTTDGGKELNIRG